MKSFHLFCHLWKNTNSSFLGLPLRKPHSIYPSASKLPECETIPDSCLVDSKLIRRPPASENLGNLQKCSFLSVNAPVIQTSWTGISVGVCSFVHKKFRKFLKFKIPLDLSEEAAFEDQLLTFSFPADPIPLYLWCFVLLL